MKRSDLHQAAGCLVSQGETKFAESLVTSSGGKRFTVLLAGRLQRC